MKPTILAAVPVALAMALPLAGCKTDPNAPSTQTTTKAFKYSTHDGMTMHSAVEIRTRSGTEGGVLIREWIRANHPGFTITEQELMPDQRGEKMYNMITILGPNDQTKRVYFDVTQFYQSSSDPFPGSSQRRTTP